MFFSLHRKAKGVRLKHHGSSLKSNGTAQNKLLLNLANVRAKFMVKLTEKVVEKVTAKVTVKLTVKHTAKGAEKVTAKVIV